MEKKNLLALDLQMFADEDVVEQETGENEVEESATSQEDESEGEESETVAENGDDEPHEQTPEENARYAAIRRKAEEDARRRYDNELTGLNQQVAAMCQGVTHPVTGQPITNVHEYIDALAIQQRQANEQELQDKGVDPALIDRMIASNPVVMQAQQVLEATKAMNAQQQLQNDLAEIMQIDPSIKGIQDLAEMPNFNEVLSNVERGLNLVDAYKIVNFSTFAEHKEGAARQQAINQMRGKAHLPSPSTSVTPESDEVEVPSEIMSRYKAEGKTEKQIRELYSTVAKKLHIGG